MLHIRYWDLNEENCGLTNPQLIKLVFKVRHNTFKSQDFMDWN